MCAGSEISSAYGLRRRHQITFTRISHLACSPFFFLWFFICPPSHRRSVRVGLPISSQSRSGEASKRANERTNERGTWARRTTGDWMGPGLNQPGRPRLARSTAGQGQGPEEASDEKVTQLGKKHRDWGVGPGRPQHEKSTSQITLPLRHVSSPDKMTIELHRVLVMEAI